MYDYSQYDFEEAPAETTSPANAEDTSTAQTTTAQGDAGASP
jgi:hypothetical protein